MTKILGVLLCDSETAYSSMPLLGKPCAGYMKDAMLAAGADADALEAIEKRLRAETRLLENQLSSALDEAADNALAAELVRKLRFMEKLAEEIHSAYDALDV